MGVPRVEFSKKGTEFFLYGLNSRDKSEIEIGYKGCRLSVLRSIYII